MKFVAGYSDKRHSGFSTEELSCKWGIGLENYRETLDFMTQMNVRSEILPLIKRYWTDLLYLILRRLSVKFYTKTLFSGILKTFHKAEDIIEMVTNRKDPLACSLSRR